MVIRDSNLQDVRTLLVTHNFLILLADYFKRPWGLRQDEVRACFDVLHGVLNRTYGSFRAQVGTAVQSIAQWPDRQWQGFDLLYPHRNELEELQRLTGVELGQPPSLAWGDAPRDEACQWYHDRSNVVTGQPGARNSGMIARAH
jgi:hypothetical protein